MPLASRRARPSDAEAIAHSYDEGIAGASARGPCTRRACHALARGVHKVTSRVFPENTPSLRLHARVGFRVVGVYRRHGRLDGAWRDCVIVEKLLDE